MNKRITITATHGDRLTIIIGLRNVSFNAYTDGSGFVVSISKEELKKLLEEKK
jgi:hypothetical protein